MKHSEVPMRRILIVDGYNAINVRRPMHESEMLEDARRALTERLHDYAGRTGQEIILVYDGWLSDRRMRSVEKRNGLEIVFTMKGETADCYIERICDELQEDIRLRRAEVRVATSDLVEQTITFGRGAIRISSRELLMEIDNVRAMPLVKPSEKRRATSTIGERLPRDVLEKLEMLRRGGKG